MALPTATRASRFARETLEQEYREGRLSRRRFVAGLAAVTAALAFGGSLREARAAAEQRAEALDALAAPRMGGVLKAGLTGQPDQLDPATSSIYTAAQMYDNIFDKLIVLDQTGYFLPALATSWRQLDSKTWQFTLVHNAVFHNGEPMTAQDVRYTFQRILNPKTAGAYTPLFSSIADVQVVDKYTVRFHLSQPFGPFLTNLAANGEIVNQKAITSLDPNRHPIGTGPFKFKEWVTSDHVTLERWSQYYQAGRPYVDSIIFRGMPVDESRLAALQSGEMQWVDAVPLQDVTRLRKGTNPVFLTAHNAGLPDFLTFVVDKPPFNNKKLRQAIAWAIDKRAILAVAYFGVGEVGSEEVPTGSSWYTSGDPYRNGPDLNKAQRLLHEAGYPNGITIEYLGLPQYPELLKTGEIIKEQLAQIGITMNITQIEVNPWSTRLVNKKYQITSAYQERTIDPDNFYSLLLTHDATLNYTGFNNLAFDALVRKAKQTSDVSVRKSIYAQIRAIMFDEVPNIFVHYETLNYAMQPRVHGVQVLPSLELRFKDVWLS
jgi:peptide/nickel transport system substrate-binding protein